MPSGYGQLFRQSMSSLPCSVFSLLWFIIRPSPTALLKPFSRWLSRPPLTKAPRSFELDRVPITYATPLKITSDIDAPWLATLEITYHFFLLWRNSSVSRPSFKRSRDGATLLTRVWIPTEAHSYSNKKQKSNAIVSFRPQGWSSRSCSTRSSSPSGRTSWQPPSPGTRSTCESSLRFQHLLGPLLDRDLHNLINM